MKVLYNNDRKKIHLGSDNDVVIKLIIVNIVASAILLFVQSVYLITKIPLAEFYNDVLAWFALPAQAAAIVYKPWTLVLFMISHLGIIELISNMLWLWAFGFIVQNIVGHRHVVPVYFYGGLAGGLVFLGINAFTDAGFMYVGASFSIMALAIAATVIAPGYRIFPMLRGGIPLWVLTLIFVAINIVGKAGVSPSVYAATAVAGICGWGYVKMLQAGKEPGKWMADLYNWFFNLFNPEKKEKRRNNKDIFYNTGGQQPFIKKHNLNQQRVDEILDKINQRGIDSLTSEEKDVLRRAGEDLTS